MLVSILFAVALIALHLAPGASEAARAPAAAALQGGAALFVLVLPATRHAALKLLAQAWPAAVAALLAIAALAIEVVARAAAIGGPGALDQIERGLVPVLGHAFGALAAAALGLAVGRDAIINGLLWAALVLALAVGVGFPDAASATATLALAAPVALFAVTEAARRRPEEGSAAMVATPRRVALPACAGLGAVAALGVAGAGWALAAAWVGALATLLVLLQRLKGPSRQGAALAAMVFLSGLIVVGAGAAAATISQALASLAGGWDALVRAPQAVLAAPLISAAFALSAGIGVAMLWARLDRGRSPGRGAALLAGIAATAALEVANGPLGAASIAFAAVLGGLAFTYGDSRRARRAPPATSEPAGTLRLG